ncbi:hypothetical protein RCL1_001196 [Eukaryota sp. TZLM3-RCL]
MAHLEALKRNWISSLCYQSCGPLSCISCNNDFSLLQPFVLRSIHSWEQTPSIFEHVVIDEIILINASNDTLAPISVHNNNTQLPLSRRMLPFSFQREVLLPSEADTPIINQPLTITIQPHWMRPLSSSHHEFSFTLTVHSSCSFTSLVSLTLFISNIETLNCVAINGMEYIASSVKGQKQALEGRKLTIASNNNLEHSSQNFEQIFQEFPVSVTLIASFPAKNQDIDIYSTFLTTKLEQNQHNLIIKQGPQQFSWTTLNVNQTEMTRSLIDKSQSILIGDSELFIDVSNSRVFVVGEISKMSTKRLKNQLNQSNLLKSSAQSLLQSIGIENNWQHYLIKSVSGRAFDTVKIQGAITGLIVQMSRFPVLIVENSCKVLITSFFDREMSVESLSVNRDRSQIAPKKSRNVNSTILTEKLPGLQLRSRYVYRKEQSNVSRKRTNSSTKEIKKFKKEVEHDLDDGLFCDLAVLPVFKQEPKKIVEI